MKEKKFTDLPKPVTNLTDAFLCALSPSVMLMGGNYDERLVANDRIGDAIIDTVEITDSSYNFETAIMHPQYNGDEWIIVEEYNTIEQARNGHKKWVNIMNSENLPSFLADVSTCEIKDILGESDIIFPREEI